MFHINTAILSKEETIAKMNELGFTLSTFEEWNRDTYKDYHFAEQTQFATYDTNFKQLEKWNHYPHKKYYLVFMSGNRVGIRAWATTK